MQFNNSKARLHFHKSIELVFALQGNFEIRVGQKTATLQSGQIMFVPSYFAHAIQHIGEAFSYTLIIPENYLKNNFLQPLQYFILDDEKINQQILTIFEKIKEAEEGLFMQGLVFELLGIIQARYTPTSPEDKTNSLTVQIIKYLQENFTKTITLEEISAHFGYSKYYFSRKFNETFGCSLNTYVNRIRFDNVTEFVGKGNMTERILSSGFNNLSTFYKMKNKLSK